MNMIDLRLQHKSFNEHKDIIVKTSYSKEKLVKKAEKVMREVEKDADDTVLWEQHADILEERLDIEVFTPAKAEAVCVENPA